MADYNQDNRPEEEEDEEEEIDDSVRLRRALRYPN